MRARVLVFASLMCLTVGRADELAAITGLITDPAGRSVPGVTIIITNLSTDVTAQTTTNYQGIYRIPALPPGIYRMTIDKDGFKSIVKSGIELHVQDVASINFELQIGSVNETVTVEAGGLVINTTDASVSTVIDHTYVENMPLNGRSFQDLILLTPGVVTLGPQANANINVLGKTGEFSVNGQRTESNSYTVDGVSANVGTGGGSGVNQGSGPSGSVPGASALGTTQALVSVDDLQEFRVQSSSYSAEYGRNPGGQFAFETKSGANQWHGTAYDYLRNGVFDANDWFNDYFGVKEPALRQNDFGGTFGGPVEIPGLYHGKDKTFFFVSYEGLRLAAPQAGNVNYVPDLCLRGVNPASNCAGTATPAAAALQPALNAFPLPSPGGIDDVANGIAQFIGSWSNPASLNSTSVRFDHVVNDKLRLFFRFSDTTSNSATRGTFAQALTPSVEKTSAYTMRTYTAGVSSVFSSRLSNEFRLNYSSNVSTSSQMIDMFGGATPVNLAQLAGVAAGSEPIVYIYFGGGPAQLLQGRTSVVQRQWNLVDTANLSSGRHQFKFGMDYRRLTPFAILPTLVPYYFFTESAAQSNSPFSLVLPFAPSYPLYENFSAFVQDEWRESQRFSLSLGLRWEVNPAPGVTQGLKPYTVQGSSPSTWSLAPQGTPLWQTTWFNFAPRLGAAYVLRNTPAWETVVRGGGGVFFDTGQQLGSLGFGGPGFSAVGSGPASFSGTVIVPPIVNPPMTPYSGTPNVFSAHLQLPYTIQWNASIEQALGKSQAISVSYVGSHAARLLQENEFSVPTNPNAQSFIIVQNGLTSDYDSLQVQFRRRLSRGLTALASYTWSHCIDYGSENYNFGYQRGNCDFDVRNNLSAAFSYDLPAVGNNGFVKILMHHWGLDDRFTARSAFPVTLFGLPLVQPDGKTYDAGLSLVPGEPIYIYGANCASVLQGLGDLQPGQECPGGRAINPNAFANDSSGLGNAPRNFATGFGAWQMNLAVRRDFPIRERLKLQFRAEVFNIFNHPNLGAINGSFGQSTFGQATATLANSPGILSPLYQTGGSRSMQFALKFVF
jgi:hypothetical protein